MLSTFLSLRLDVLVIWPKPTRASGKFAVIHLLRSWHHLEEKQATGRCAISKEKDTRILFEQNTVEKPFRCSDFQRHKPIPFDPISSAVFCLAFSSSSFRSLSSRAINLVPLSRFDICLLYIYFHLTYALSNTLAESTNFAFLRKTLFRTWPGTQSHSFINWMIPRLIPVVWS